jgi:hypothetical protein
VLKNGECVKPCPEGMMQGATGKCVPAAAVQQRSIDACAARGMVRRGNECVKPCPAGTIQGPTGKCIKVAK